MFNQDHGVYVGDMFGSLADSPLLRMAREEQYNRANAEEEMKARTAPQALRPWETPESVAEETNLRWNVPLARPGVHDIRSVGGSIFERDPLTGDWGLAASAPARPGAQSNKVQDFAKYDKLLAAAEVETNPTRRAQILEQAALLKAILEKAGKFAPPPPAKPATQSDSTSVNWFTNPTARFDTNAPPLIPRTNFSSRVTGPLGTNSLGAFGQGLSLGGFGGGTNAPSEAVSEVIKIAPNGRRAVFDSRTKQFIRYAD